MYPITLVIVPWSLSVVMAPQGNDEHIYAQVFTGGALEVRVPECLLDAEDGVLVIFI